MDTNTMPPKEVVIKGWKNEYYGKADADGKKYEGMNYLTARATIECPDQTIVVVEIGADMEREDQDGDRQSYHYDYIYSCALKEEQEKLIDFIEAWEDWCNKNHAILIVL